MSDIRTPELAEAIIAGISEGIPLRQLCRIHGVGKSSIYRWMEDDADLAGRFARARIEGFDAIADEVFEIADTVPERIGTQFGDKVDPGFVQHQKNRMEMRLKLLAKWDPKRYGERVDHTSSDGSMSPKGLEDFYSRPITTDGPDQ